MWFDSIVTSLGSSYSKMSWEHIGIVLEFSKGLPEIIHMEQNISFLHILGGNKQEYVQNEQEKTLWEVKIFIGLFRFVIFIV